MSPERFKGQNDARSDLYALGLTLYELLALRPAFEAKDRERLMYQIAHVRPDPVRKHNPEVPLDLETIIAKSIEQRPADRYQTAAAFGQDLRRFLDDRPIHARRVTTSERIARWARRNPGVAGLAAALVASLAVIAVGASVAAIQLGIKHEAAVRYLNDALHAQDDARRKLWEADLARVHATRQGKALGQRFEGLRVVREAVAIGVNRSRDRELRNEAIACLALADLRVAWSQAIEEQAADLSILFDSDFTRYAQAHHKGEVSIHDKEDGRVLARLPGEGKVAAPIRWSADGRFLAARYEGGRGTEVRVWNLETNQPALPVLQGVYAHAFDFDATGKLAATGHRDGSIRIHDLESGQEVRRIGVGVVPYIMRFHPSLRQVAIGCAVREAAVQLLDIDSGQVIVSRALPSEAQGLTWSPSGKRLAVGDYAGRIHVFDDLTSKAPARVFHGHYGNVASLAVHSENEILASASWDGTIRLWDLRTGAELLQAPMPEAGPLQFSRDGKYLGYGRDRTQFTYWEIATGHECRATVAPPGTGFRTESADFHPSGEFMVSTNTANVRIDSPSRGEALAVLPLTGAADAVFTPDGESLITSGTTGL
jgi:hypothetical protein